MPLETAQFISELVATNPLGTDPKAQGDDHLRLVKDVLQKQFPNFEAAAVDTTVARLNEVTNGQGVVGVSYFQSGEIVVGTGIIPADDTIPQITEGDEYLAVTHTPKKAGNRIRVEVVFNYTDSGGNTQTMAVFLNGAANAIAAAHNRDTTVQLPQNMALNFFTTAPNANPMVFTVRSGNSAVHTTTMNGQQSARTHGGVLISSITITEIDAEPGP